MPVLRQAIWGHIWERTVEKSQTNATNVTLHPHGQGIWRDILKSTVEKSQTNAANLTMHPLRQVIWGHIWNTHNGEKPNKSNQCDYASSRADSLRTHLVEHSGEKPDKCNQCDFTSSRADVLRTHLKCTVGKSQTNATSVTRKVIWGDIWWNAWGRIRNMNVLILCGTIVVGKSWIVTSMGGETTLFIFET